MTRMPTLDEIAALRQALLDAQARGTELAGSRLPLTDPIGQPRAHVVDQQVGVKIRGLVAQSRDRQRPHRLQLGLSRPC